MSAWFANHYFRCYTLEIKTGFANVDNIKLSLSVRQTLDHMTGCTKNNVEMALLSIFSCFIGGVSTWELCFRILASLRRCVHLRHKYGRSIFVEPHPPLYANQSLLRLLDLLRTLVPLSRVSAIVQGMLVPMLSVRVFLETLM